MNFISKLKNKKNLTIFFEDKKKIDLDFLLKIVAKNTLILNSINDLININLNLL